MIRNFNPEPCTREELDLLTDEAFAIAYNRASTDEGRDLVAGRRAVRLLKHWWNSGTGRDKGKAL